jgi:Zn-dependent protease
VPDHESTPGEVPVAELVVGHAPASEVVQAEFVAEPPVRQRRRRITLPLILFFLTCVSTFVAGATGWMPGEYLMGPVRPTLEPDPYLFIAARRMLLEHWQEGLIYMGCVLAILLTHEMGHFVMTVIYQVRASLPLFIPFPISPLGTMGAVIAMDGSKADRRQIFDIGLAGPLAGLVVAVPVIWIGASQLDLATPPQGYRFGLPLAARYLLEHLQPGMYRPDMGVAVNQLNPYFMAGWVGLLVTGLNMMPVSQLDGGHVMYALFGRGAHWMARLFMLAVFISMGISYYVYQRGTIPSVSVGFARRSERSRC